MSTLTANSFLNLRDKLSIETKHKDLIHDVQLDFFGKKIATASSDNLIQIFSCKEGSTGLSCDVLAGHNGPVWQVSWSHPKFGPLLASCSYDGTVLIWKEESAGKWMIVKSHKVHEGSVNSVSWAPDYLGAAVACASSDCRISILEYKRELNEWIDYFQDDAHQIGCNSISWCPSVIMSSLSSSSSSPNKKRLVTGGADNLVKIWEVSGSDGKWDLEIALKGHKDWVRDASWCPRLKNGFETIASCSLDKSVILWRKTPSSPSSESEWELKYLNKDNFPDVIWKVSWSPSGDLLAVSCGDGRITIWSDEGGEFWNCIADMTQ